MNIVILHECFFNEQHLTRLKKIGIVSVYQDTDSEQKAIARLQDANIVIVDQFITPFDKKVLESARHIKLIVLNSISYSNVDLKTASRLGIKVANVAGFSKQTVAEFTLALLFAINRKITLADRLMHQHPLELDPGNTQHQQFIGFELKGKTLGIIGLGNIGTTVANIAQSLGMKVIAYSRSQKKVTNVKIVSLPELLKTSDIITLHLPLNPKTKNMIAKKEINLMKHNAIIINTSQPEIIDIDALTNALQTKKIYGAALDCGNIIPKDHLLYKQDNVILTPHMASFTHEAFFENMPHQIIETVEAFIKRKPINIVN